LMAEAGFVDPTVASAAQALPVAPGPQRPRSVGALYVADQVRRELRRLLPLDVAQSPALTVFTSIDPDAQREAEQAVRRGLDGLDHGGRTNRRGGGEGPGAARASPPLENGPAPRPRGRARQHPPAARPRAPRR